MTCREICVRYRADRNPDGSRYGNGIQRCFVCEIFIKYDKPFCPCCGYRLRTKSRNKKSKERLRSKL